MFKIFAPKISCTSDSMWSFCKVCDCTVYSVLYSISNFDTKNLKNSVYVIPIAAQKKSIGTVETLYDNSSNTSILSNFTIEI